MDDVPGEAPDDLNSHLDEILSSEDVGKTVLTEYVLRKLAERIYDKGCLMSQSGHPSQIYECVVFFLVVATACTLAAYQWIFYAIVKPPIDKDELLIDLRVLTHVFTKRRAVP